MEPLAGPCGKMRPLTQGEGDWGRMASVTGFKHNVFISYARVDDRPAVPRAHRWVQSLAETLETQIAQQTGRYDQNSVWRDTVSVENNVEIPRLLRDALASSAVLLVIYSPGYVASDWCMGELRDFIGDGSAVREGRVFVVEKMPLNVCGREAASIAQLPRIPFWREVNQRPRTWGVPHLEGDERFFELVEDLSHQIVRQLRRQEERLQGNSPVLLGSPSIWEDNTSNSSMSVRAVNQGRQEQTGFSCELSAVLQGHNSLVLAATFSSNGRWLLTASADQTARVWDVATGGELATLQGHEAPIISAVFSSDGTRALTGSHDATARLWETAAGKELLVLRGHKRILTTASFSPDDLRLLTASDDGTALVTEASSGKVLASLLGHSREVVSAVFSANGTRVLTASSDKSACLWDTLSGRQLSAMRGHQAVLSSAEFSRDDTRILTSSRDGTVRLWNATDGSEIQTLRGHELAVTGARFSADCRYILSRSRDRTARLWDAASGRELAILGGHEAWVDSAEFSDDGMYAVTTSANARLWRIPTGEELAVLGHDENGVTRGAFSPDGTRVAVAFGDGTVRLWSVRS